MKLKGNITISNVQSTHEGDFIRIEIVDANSGIAFVRTKLTLENFSQALTGKGWTDCELDVHGLDNVGMLAENKTVVVPTQHPYGDEAQLAKAIQAIQVFEVDGWRGNIRDLNNHYRTVPGGILVTFYRFVPRPAEAK